MASALDETYMHPNRRALTRAATLIAGLLLLLSGAAKIGNPLPAAIYLTHWSSLDLDLLERIVRVVASLEIWIAIGIGVTPRGGWRVAAALLGVGFAITFVGFGLLAFGDTVECGCFGTYLRLDRWSHLGVSAMLLIGCAAGLQPKREVNA